MAGLSLPELAMEAWIIYLVFQSKTTHVLKNKSSLPIETNLILRLVVFTAIQLVTLALTAILSAVRLGDDLQYITNVYRVVESLNVLATFFVFGMSNRLLEAWRLKKPTSVQSDFRELERGWDQNLVLDTEILESLSNATGT
ncbi:hypothetical protein M422DRAFT_269990 [Sphaerobolus stellatus SS14]|uniref:Uncharacterized protein n=1 Tax=Sphaerobolus stellatus (strain SS14) TaxID=990650 RepID=A0A0C9UU13_SPHS4|nr:hypothetical protein M422DRAFT_269990 [Sphaerobolus stellatus SS14]